METLLDKVGFASQGHLPVRCWSGPWPTARPVGRLSPLREIVRPRRRRPPRCEGSRDLGCWIIGSLVVPARLPWPHCEGTPLGRSPAPKQGCSEPAQTEAGFPKPFGSERLPH